MIDKMMRGCCLQNEWMDGWMDGWMSESMNIGTIRIPVC
jgi:hypothetical protein